MNPIRVAAIPPKERGIIMLASAGIESTAYDVPRAPIKEIPVVL